jgi:hypothetical protein
MMKKVLSEMLKSQFSKALAGVGLSLLLSGFLFSEDPVVLSQWAASPIQLDGRAGEWASDSLLHLDKIDLDCGFKNDARNLYILIVFKDPKHLSSIDSMGITISGAPDGAKEKSHTVMFITTFLTADEYISMLEEKSTRLTGNEKGDIRRRARYPVFAAYPVDKKGKALPSTGLAAGDEEPPAFRATRFANISTYEFRVPLSSREAYPAGIEAEPGEAISISLEWGGAAKKTLSPRTSWSTPGSIVSGGAIGDNDETRAQEFLNSFDSMSRPSLETKKYSFGVDVRLAKPF